MIQVKVRRGRFADAKLQAGTRNGALSRDRAFADQNSEISESSEISELLISHGASSHRIRLLSLIGIVLDLIRLSSPPDSRSSAGANAK
jgi:hypothetical protein